MHYTGKFDRGVTWLDSDLAQINEDVRILRRHVGGLVADVVFVAGSVPLFALTTFTRSVVSRLDQALKSSVHATAARIERHPRCGLLFVAGAAALLAVSIVRSTRSSPSKAIANGQRH